MDQYKLPKRINRIINIVSLDEIMALESNCEMRDMTTAKQLFYSGMSRDEEGDKE